MAVFFNNDFLITYFNTCFLSVAVFFERKLDKYFSHHKTQSPLIFRNQEAMKNLAFKEDYTSLYFLGSDPRQFRFSYFVGMI
jgi:hypothetical protein